VSRVSRQSLLRALLADGKLDPASVAGALSEGDRSALLSLLWSEYGAPPEAEAEAAAAADAAAVDADVAAEGASGLGIGIGGSVQEAAEMLVAGWATWGKDSVGLAVQLARASGLALPPQAGCDSGGPAAEDGGDDDSLRLLREALGQAAEAVIAALEKAGCWGTGGIMSHVMKSGTVRG
jgi:hypothetical protein